MQAGAPGWLGKLVFRLRWSRRPTDEAEPEVPRHVKGRPALVRCPLLVREHPHHPV